MALRAEMGLNRADSGKRAGFVESVLGLVNAFYEQVVQGITPWRPLAPKAKEIEPEPDGEAGEAIRQAPAPVLVDGTA